MSNKIISRKYYKISIALASPVNIGNGSNNLTDADVMRNSCGECFIPGTSLAGAFRNYLGINKDTISSFGYTDGEDGNMSSVFVSDLYFNEGITTSVRDRVDLTDDKGVNNKFDLEIIEPGATGTINIETVCRENMTGNRINPDDDVVDIILALADGDIRLGSVKNRGFGRIKVESVSELPFDKSKRDEWISYISSDYDNCENAICFDEWKKEKSRRTRYVKCKVPLTLTGGISIRKYSAQPGRADFEHITTGDGVPVIPGTSWNGAIRADARQILIDLARSSITNNIDIDKDRTAYKIADELVDQWFGKVKGKEENDSWQSKIVFAESRIEANKFLPMTRNNINRFTAGTTDGALYTELSCIGGTTELEYMIMKSDAFELADALEMEALAGLMTLVVRDICEGFVAIGGQVAVGRGIFKGDYTTPFADGLRESWLKALYQVIKWRAESC